MGYSKIYEPRFSDSECAEPFQSNNKRAAVHSGWPATIAIYNISMFFIIPEVAGSRDKAFRDIYGELSLGDFKRQGKYYQGLRFQKG
ncbi:hypothetical protein D3C78_1517520 [compost metagenome]